MVINPHPENICMLNRHIAHCKHIDFIHIIKVNSTNMNMWAYYFIKKGTHLSAIQTKGLKHLVRMFLTPSHGLFLSGMFKERWSSGPEGGYKYTRVMVKSVSIGPVGNTWVHQSLTVSTLCNDPPQRHTRKELTTNQKLKTVLRNSGT